MKYNVETPQLNVIPSQRVIKLVSGLLRFSHSDVLGGQYNGL